MSDPHDLPTVSVVVPTFNRRDRVGRCIDAVLSDPATTEVVVVVDGSDDGTLELLERRSATDPRVRPVLVEHGGHQAARQAGVERAIADVVLLLDDDVIAGPEMVSGHARHHVRGDDLVVVGYMPVALPATREPGDFARHLYSTNYEWACAQWQRDPITILQGLWGGNISLPRALAVRVGLTSTVGPMPYGEDRELGLRLLRAGVTAVFDRELRATHEHSRDLDGFLREATARAVGDVLVHAAHHDLIGPLELNRYEAHLPLPARLAVRAARVRVIGRLEVTGLRTLIRVAGAVRWWRLESLAATVAMHVVEVMTIVERGGR